MTTPLQTSASGSAVPWQLSMFRKGLKKRQRLKALKEILLPVAEDERCLLLTCGDNNGAMNYFLRELGGRWTWADLESTSIPEMSSLLGEPVHHVMEDNLPFDDAGFDRIVVIDVHEHVDEPGIVTRELVRVLKPGAQLVITTPNGDESKLAVRIKSLVGMSVETYGHTRAGLTSREIEQLMRADGVRPVRTMSFSRFFTEMLELTINFLYVKVLRKDADVSTPANDQTHAAAHAHADHPEIAPATAEQLQKVKISYRIYSLIFPLYWLISQLDHLLYFSEGYCVIVEGTRER